MSDIIIKLIDANSPEYQGVWQVREHMLRKPLGMSLRNENIDWDREALIFAALHNELVIGCVLLTRIDEQTAKLRAMAVCDAWQGKGVGRLLVNALEETALQNGYKKIALHARKVALDFYKKLDYAIIGNEFTEVGIPHYKMEKELHQ